MLDKQQTARERDQAEQLDRLAEAIEHLPGRLATVLRSANRPSNSMRGMLVKAEKEHREAKEAKRRANIAIALTGLTALASLIAAIGTLIQAG